jgi:hypothetical protein
LIFLDLLFLKIHIEGGHWPFADWVMTRKDGVIMPTFCNYSRNYNGARDDYLYIYLIRFQSDEGQDDYPDKVAWLNCQKTGLIDLTRVPKNEMLNHWAYTFNA